MEMTSSMKSEDEVRSMRDALVVEALRRNLTGDVERMRETITQAGVLTWVIGEIEMPIDELNLPV